MTTKYLSLTILSIFLSGLFETLHYSPMSIAFMFIAIVLAIATFFVGVSRGL